MVNNWYDYGLSSEDIEVYEKDIEAWKANLVEIEMDILSIKELVGFA